jgi:hypothetical protein
VGPPATGDDLLVKAIQATLYDRCYAQRTGIAHGAAPDPEFARRSTSQALTDHHVWVKCVSHFHSHQRPPDCCKPMPPRSKRFGACATAAHSSSASSTSTSMKEARRSSATSTKRTDRRTLVDVVRLGDREEVQNATMKWLVTDLRALARHVWCAPRCYVRRMVNAGRRWRGKG